ncbi:MAG: hypothetical protein SPJ13_01990, partial [Bacteroidales bacterium]|nr:hypothetical protein [Bacteroidales bacterium]
MKKFLMMMFLCVFALGGTTYAQIGGAGAKKATDLNEKVPVDRRVKMGKLDNGLTYYIRANRKPEGRVQFFRQLNLQLPTTSIFR